MFTYCVMLLFSLVHILVCWFLFGVCNSLFISGIASIIDYVFNVNFMQHATFYFVWFYFHSCLINKLFYIKGDVAYVFWSTRQININIHRTSKKTNNPKTCSTTQPMETAPYNEEKSRVRQETIYNQWIKWGKVMLRVIIMR